MPHDCCLGYNRLGYDFKCLRRPNAPWPNPPARPTTFSVGRRVLILIMVVLGSTLYATTLLIASTLLPQMQGTMSATQDEIAWAMTFNILATAVVTPMTGWLAARFGRRETMIWSVLLFTVATYHVRRCRIRWRRWCSGASLQGALGAPVIPLSQTILLDAFPKRQQGLVTSIFGMAVVIGPVIGPTLGGLLSEIYSWRWAFYMIVPVGVALVHRAAAHPAAPTGRAGRVRARLDRLPGALRRDRLRAARAVARPAARLVRIAARSWSRPSSPSLAF